MKVFTKRSFFKRNMVQEALVLTIVIKKKGRLNAVFFFLEDPLRDKVSDHPNMYTFSEEGRGPGLYRSIASPSRYKVAREWFRDSIDVNAVVRRNSRRNGS